MALVLATPWRTGGLAGPRVPGISDLYLAGDWVGPEGFLVDASMVSAHRAAQLALPRTRTGTVLAR